MRGERLFVAVPLPPQARDNLATALPPLPGRPVVSEKWHFTLKFLGQTAPSARDRLIAELGREPLGECVRVGLHGLGAFPTPGRARVLWVGVEPGAAELTRLAEVVARACERANLRSDERPYSPHLTLRRLHPPRDVRRIIVLGASISVEAVIAEVLLMRSVPGQGPPRYDAVARYQLAAGK